jgi:Ca2+-binding RTX toxin-like protein
VHRTVALVLTVPVLWLAPTAVHAAGTCQGLSATIESPGGGTVTGTDGPDVILVTGPATVSALGGDDTVCVAGGSLDAGAGDDHVVAAGAHGQEAVLGPGDDSYASTGLIDRVDLDEGDSAGTDTIDSGAGLNDEIGTGTAKDPNHDHVTTDEYGSVHLQAPAGSDVRLSGGGAIDLDAADAASYVFDAPHGTLERNGTRVASYDDTTKVFEVAGRRARVTVHGSDTSDFVWVRRVAAFQADLDGGSDHVYLFPGSPRHGRIDGGHGDDWLFAHAKDSAVGDLARHRLTLTSRGRAARWQPTSFGNVQVAGLRIDIRGSSAGETIKGFGCDVTLRGLGGKDALQVGGFERGWPPASRCPGGEKGQHGHLYGGGANDTLWGGDGPDVLLGGAGRDTAGGQGGRDRCEAERETSCEL